MDDFDFEEEEFQKLRSNLKLFGSPDHVERKRDGPGFYLVRWVMKNGLKDGGVGWTEEFDYFDTIEELVEATNAAITKRANDKFVAASIAEGRRGKR